MIEGVLALLGTLFATLFSALLKFVMAFAVGTGAAALACWYYDAPLVFALGGGFLVLGLALALVLGTDGFGV